MLIAFGNGTRIIPLTLKSTFEQNPARQAIGQSLCLFGLILMAVSMPLSMFGMSLSQFIIGGAWVWYGNYGTRLRAVLQLKTLWVFWLIYAMHLAGCTYSSDMHYALSDLRIKLPLLVFPFLIATMPVLRKKHYHLILSFFVFGVVVSSLISFFVWLRIIPALIRETRDISIFISHIRLSLMVVLAIFISSYFCYNSYKYLKKVAWATSAIWLFAFLFILESLTGIVILCCTAFLLSVVYLYRSKKILPLTVLCFAVVIVLSLGGVYFRAQMMQLGNCDNSQPVPPAAFTLNGNPYTHVKTYTGCENGNRLGWYICMDELRDAWNARSKFTFDSVDGRKQPLPHTLIRYMTSKNMRKDSAAVYALTANDIKAIEKGFANYRYVHMNGLQLRMVEIAYELNEYNRTGNASGFSIAQRIEYNKGSWYILTHHLLTGVGTGDNKKAFADYYTITHSKLREQWRLRSHNQYMAIAVSFGIPGLLLFLFALFFPVAKHKAHDHIIFLVFFAISLLSFINEDTLESQAGLTFFIFFYAVIVWGVLREQVGVRKI